MFPYHDENETQRTPYVTIVLIGINVLAWKLTDKVVEELRAKKYPKLLK
jgi:hypothetical protein